MVKKLLCYGFAAGCCILVFNSCSKIASQLVKSASINWTATDVTLSIFPQSDTNLHTSMGTGTLTANIDSVIKANTSNMLGISNVDTFRFNSCTLTIQNPDLSNNFGNFQTAMAAFSTSYVPTVTNLGEIDNNPSTYASVLNLPINNTTNLRSYLPNSGAVTINYTYGGKLRIPTTTTLTISVHAEYYIHVKS